MSIFQGKERAIEPEKSADETNAGSSSQLSELQLLREKVERQQKVRVGGYSPFRDTHRLPEDPGYS